MGILPDSSIGTTLRTPPRLAVSYPESSLCIYSG